MCALFGFPFWKVVSGQETLVFFLDVLFGYRYRR